MSLAEGGVGGSQTGPVEDGLPVARPAAVGAPSHTKYVDGDEPAAAVRAEIAGGEDTELSRRLVH